MGIPKTLPSMHGRNVRRNANWRTECLHYMYHSTHTLLPGERKDLRVLEVSRNVDAVLPSARSDDSFMEFKHDRLARYRHVESRKAQYD